MSAPYVPFYTSDFLGGTSGMTATTKGVYITILCLIYETEGPLPQKWETLARRCGCTLPAFKRSIEALIDDGKVVIVDGEIWSEKVEKHIAQRCERRSSAKAAAKTRWEKTKENQGQPDASASSAQCQPEPEPEPERVIALSRSKPTPERFNEFWEVYPHRGGAKRGRKPALEKYTRLVASGISEHLLIEGAKRSASDRMVIDGYARDPATWLNQEGWTDEIDETLAQVSADRSARLARIAKLAGSGA